MCSSFGTLWAEFAENSQELLETQHGDHGRRLLEDQSSHWILVLSALGNLGFLVLCCHGSMGLLQHGVFL